MDNLVLIAPELGLAVFAVAIVLFDLFVGNKRSLAVLSLVGLGIAGVVTIIFAFLLPEGDAAVAFGGMLAVDGFALFFKLLFLGIAALIILASRDYSAKFKNFQGEYLSLILIATLGLMLMASTTELISIYLAVELTSIAFYVLAGFLKDGKSSEASLKYTLLGAVASAVMLYGMALVFGSTGQTQLGEIAVAIQSIPNVSANPAFVLGVVLLIAGFGFKIASVPFQMWIPDVYEGAPTPITAYLSVGSKAAGFAVILRVFSTAFGFPSWLSFDWGMIFGVLAAISMFAGNVIAIPQTNIKRMLGYSSIAQAGYLMVGLAAVGVAYSQDLLGESGILFFLVSYALTNLAAFITIIAITNKINSDLIDDFAGMGKRCPVVALVLTLAMISLIGLPPAAGFMAKFYIFSGAVQHGLLWLVIIAVINSAISAFYYLRVVKVMWLNKPASEERIPSSGSLKVAIAISAIGVLFLGIVPGTMLGATQVAAKIFGF